MTETDFERIRAIVREEIERKAAEDAAQRRPCGRMIGTPCPHFPTFGHQCPCEGMHTTITAGSFT